MSKSGERPSRRATLLGERPGSYAIARDIRMSATKVRRVLDLVRGMDAHEALDHLRFAPQAAAEPIGKVVASAVANAETNDGLNGDDLFISQAFADEGVSLHRIKARAKGRADRIVKRAAHITVVVEPKGSEGAGTVVPRKPGKAIKAAAPVAVKTSAKAAAKVSEPEAEAKKPAAKKATKATEAVEAKAPAAKKPAAKEAAAEPKAEAEAKAAKTTTKSKKEA
jgi:large subunit ribosomal protein L22